MGDRGTRSGFDRTSEPRLGQLGTDETCKQIEVPELPIDFDRSAYRIAGADSFGTFRFQHRCVSPCGCRRAFHAATDFGILTAMAKPKAPRAHSKAPHRPEKFERERAWLRPARFYNDVGDDEPEVFEYYIRHVPVRSRSREAVRRALDGVARRYFRVMLDKTPFDADEVHSEFMESFDSSSAIDNLLAERSLSKDQLNEALTVLLRLFEGRRRSATPVEVKLGLSKTPIDRKELRRREQALQVATQAFRAAGRDRAARMCGNLQGRYLHALSWSPTKPKKIGAPASRRGTLALQLDVTLGAMRQADRHRLVARLVTDFLEPIEPEQVKDLLRQRYAHARVTAGSVSS